MVSSSSTVRPVVTPQNSSKAEVYALEKARSNSQHTVNSVFEENHQDPLIVRSLFSFVNFLFSIRLLLVCVLVFVVLVVLIITWFIGFNTGNTSVLDMNSKLKASYAKNLGNYLNSKFKPAVDLSNAYKNLFTAFKWNLKNDSAIFLNSMFSVFKGINPDNVFVSVGDKTGYFAWGVQNIYSFADAAMVSVDGADFYSIKDGKVQQLMHIPGVDNTKSPYWLLMNVSNPKTSWTDIGYNQVDPDFYISFVTPFWIDSEFHYCWSSVTFGRSLSSFMQSTPVSKNAVTMLIDRKGLLIGSSSTADPSFIIKDGIPVQSTPLDGNTTFVKDGFRKLTKLYNLATLNGTVSTSVSWNGYDVDVDAIPYTYSSSITGMDWIIVIFSPQIDILGDIWIQFRNGLLISLGIMVFGAAVVFIFSLLITFPLSSLSKDINKIARLEISSKKQRRSFLTEVKEIQIAVDKMKFGLRSFNKYVPSSLVKALLESSTEASLGVQELNVTLLFSDIENFTTICEKMDPNTLVICLSEYLDRATNHIIESGGTVDKFIGDAIMAFWNAPFAIEDHAYKACKSALNIQRDLKDLYSIWEKRGLPEFKTRIGIHTGNAFIGNVGTPERMNYTALGDNVNSASRIEGINKNYGTYIAVSQATYCHVSNRLLCVPLDSVTVKGKTKPLVIYELICESSIAPEEELYIQEFYQGAVDKFSEQDYKKCLEYVDKIETKDKRAHRIVPIKEKCWEMMKM